jgi:hypothetical protein
MCCFFAALMFFGPRFGFLVYWLLAPVRVNTSLASLNFPWLVSLLGLIFAPWTLLMWVAIFPMNGFDWIWLGFGVMADVAAYLGGYAKRQDVPGYPASDPLKPPM